MSETSEKKLPGESFFSKAADILILNFFCLICCIPVITIADSLSSLYSVMLKLERGKGEGVVKPFFRFFAGNFFKSIPYTLIMIVFFVMFTFGYIAFGYNGSSIAIGALLAFGVLFVCWFGWVIPLFAQFDNSLGNMLFNAVKLAYANPRTTLIILGMNVYMIALFLIAPEIFSYVLFVWSFVGLAVSAKIISKQLVPVFDELIEHPEPGEEDGQ